MDRDAFFAGLRLHSIRPIDVVSFYRGLPARMPGGSSDEAVAAREAVADHLGRLNAATLDRDHDPRVAVDIDEMSATLGNRFERFTSTDWATHRHGMETIDLARQTLAEIRLALRLAETGVAPEVDSWGDPVD